ncbi:hypothetical protein [Egbenema bharatensis]|uniref:hypothetical protein n=1 Tax=Egbenema bharatensis TaxID=3463334 RepID=UPI003A86E66D
MTTIPVQFTYFTGLSQKIFDRVRLSGSWDQNGRYSEQWTTVPMQPFTAPDGCPGFTTTVQFDPSQMGYLFRWGIVLDSPQGKDLWGIPTEIKDRHSRDRFRSFTLQSPNHSGPQQERYYLTHCRWLGAQKSYLPGQATPAVQFAVWAPHARSVEVVLGNLQSGYIADDGCGMDAHLGPSQWFGLRQESGKRMSRFLQNWSTLQTLTTSPICSEW